LRENKKTQKKNREKEELIQTLGAKVVTLKGLVNSTKLQQEYMDRALKPNSSPNSFTPGKKEKTRINTSKKITELTTQIKDVQATINVLKDKGIDLSRLQNVEVMKKTAEERLLGLQQAMNRYDVSTASSAAASAAPPVRHPIVAPVPTGVRPTSAATGPMSSRITSTRTLIPPASTPLMGPQTGKKGGRRTQKIKTHRKRITQRRR